MRGYVNIFSELMLLLRVMHQPQRIWRKTDGLRRRRRTDRAKEEWKEEAREKKGGKTRAIGVNIMNHYELLLTEDIFSHTVFRDRYTGPLDTNVLFTAVRNRLALQGGNCLLWGWEYWSTVKAIYYNVRNSSMQPEGRKEIPADMETSSPVPLFIYPHLVQC